MQTSFRWYSTSGSNGKYRDISIIFVVTCPSRALHRPRNVRSIFLSPAKSASLWYFFTDNILTGCRFQFRENHRVWSKMFEKCCAIFLVLYGLSPLMPSHFTACRSLFLGRTLATLWSYLFSTFVRYLPCLVLTNSCFVIFVYLILFIFNPRPLVFCLVFLLSATACSFYHSLLLLVLTLVKLSKVERRICRLHPFQPITRPQQHVALLAPHILLKMFRRM